jgi:hypothetical protein
MLGNLKNLKKLSIYIKLDDFHTAIVEIYELIKKHATSLIDLELKFRDNQTDIKTVKTMVEDYFQSVLPNLKINYTVRNNFRCGIGKARSGKIPIPHRKLFLTVYIY